MGLNETQSAERVHIGFFGRRNVGKSSVVNAVTNQELAVVSDVKGTTTDPVRKSMELLPLGPVLIIDTPGFDDEGMLGQKRVQKTRQVIRETDIAVLVADSTEGLQTADYQLLAEFRENKVPCLLVLNKADLLPDGREKLAGGAFDWTPAASSADSTSSTAGTASVYTESKSKQDIPPVRAIYVSAQEKANISQLKEAMGHMKKGSAEITGLLDGLVTRGDTIVLVIPIDKAAPKGRLILPEQQMVRAGLDLGASVMVTGNDRLKETLDSLKQPPRLVITDSQAFKQVDAIVPDDIPMTSFSILFARYKGTLKRQLAGIQRLKTLPANAKILISEGCTHHRQCGDIGTEKIPALLKQYVRKPFTFETSSGKGYPEDLTPYDLIIHCGGCMLNDKEMQYRVRHADEQGVPITNYGVALAEMNGILDRALRPLGDLSL
ncbi:MAG: [FeFe] hydrogenase H-cluster maturation GTPase HydF [Eubacterium sp.]